MQQEGGWGVKESKWNMRKSVGNSDSIVEGIAISSVDKGKKSKRRQKFIIPTQLVQSQELTEVIRRIEHQCFLTWKFKGRLLRRLKLHCLWGHFTVNSKMGKTITN